MKKLPPKPKRPADPIMRMHSVMQDVIAISNKPITAPKRRSRKRKSDR